MRRHGAAGDGDYKMVTGDMVVIRVKSTGSEYAYPASKYSEIPVVSINDGKPGDTNFSRSELLQMGQFGHADVVGIAKLSLDINYD